MFQPFKLAPAYKDYLWGGRRLITEYGKKPPTSTLAESWEVSTHPDGQSVITSGRFAGSTLEAFCAARLPGLGWAGQLPILIKLLDAKEDLSLQVHPNDEYARQNEGQCGKTEMWYVLGAEEGAQIACGFKEQYTRRRVEEAVTAGKLKELCAWYPAQAGDVFYIPAGTLHAIGAGVLLAEVQQSSNLTYRVDDYGRTDKNGRPRQLHVEKALDVLNTGPADRPLKRKYQLRRTPGVTTQELLGCEWFSTSILSVSGNQTIQPNPQEQAFTFFLCLEGQGMLSTEEEMVPLIKGDTIAAPPGSEAFSFVGDVSLLKVMAQI